MKTAFKFIGIKDCGSTSCPHCGAEGRYIYTWEENGVQRSAMAGCYKMLTGNFEKGENEKYFELLSEKQAKGKELNGWDKTVIKMLEFKKNGTYPESWCNEKINNALTERKNFLAKKRF